MSRNGKTLVLRNGKTLPVIDPADIPEEEVEHLLVVYSEAMALLAYRERQLGQAIATFELKAMAVEQADQLLQGAEKEFERDAAALEIRRQQLGLARKGVEANKVKREEVRQMVQSFTEDHMKAKAGVVALEDLARRLGLLPKTFVN